MSFLIDCPNCGTRPVGEFRFGGPVKERPDPSANAEEWSDYIYNRPNVCGVQTEWWFHRQGCKNWFVADRNTTTNEMCSETGRERQDDEEEREKGSGQ